jgi:hypothetical protein
MSLIVSAPKKKDKQSPYTYAWTKVKEDAFELQVPEKITMLIWRDGVIWHMRSLIGMQRFFGVRASLEDAAKAADHLLYKNFPQIWTVTDARAIMKSWKGDLRFEEI